MTALLQGSLSGGELSPSLYPRVDLARYQTSVRTGKNFIVRPYGGMVNRPGTQYIGSALGATRLIPFQVSTAVAYVVELSNLKARFIANGAYVETSPGAPAFVVTPFTDEMLFQVKYTQSADTMYFTHPDVPPETLVRVSATAFQLSEFAARFGPFDTINGDARQLITASATTGNVTLTATFAIFTADMVGTSVYLEPRELTKVKPWSQGERGIVVGDLRRSDGKTYRAVTVPSGTADWTETGPWRPIHEIGRAWDGGGLTDLRDNSVQTWYVGVQWEYVNSGYGIVQITGYSSPTSVTATVVTRLPESVVGGSTVATSWPIVGDGVTTSFAVAGAVSTSPFDYGVTGPGGIVLPSDPYTAPTFQTQGWSVDPTADTIVFNNPLPAGNYTVYEYSVYNYTDAWAFGAWSEVNGYPSEVEFYSDRLTFANTDAQPQTLWMSSTGDYTNFGKSQPIVDSDAITATLNARQLNDIRELVPLDTLLILTSGGQWRMRTGVEDIVAPSTIGFKPSGKTSASHVPCLLVDDTAIFIQDRGFSVRDLRYSFDVDGFTGNDLTVFANHLTEGKALVDWTYQKIPYSVVWIVREDGVLLAFTYMREQEIIAWTPMEMAGGKVESIACIPEGDEDAVYMVVNRTINGVQDQRYIERLTNRLFTDVRLSKFMDSCLTFDGRNTGSTEVIITGPSFNVGDSVQLTASSGVFQVGDIGDMIVFDWESGKNVRISITTYFNSMVVVGLIETPITGYEQIATTNWAWARNTISGLDHLEGETVTVLADGFVPDTAVVQGGSITLADPAVMVHVGLPYTSDLAMLDIQAPGPTSVRMNAKNIKRMGLLVQQSRGIWFGPSFEKMDEKEPRQDEQYQSPPDLLEELLELWPESGWSPDARIHVQQRDPLPLCVAGVIADCELGS